MAALGREARALWHWLRLWQVLLLGTVCSIIVD